MSWSRSARGRRELAWVGAIALVSVVVPIATEELFPFSRMGLFTDAPRTFAIYEIRDASGRAHAPGRFGLGARYFGLRGHSADRPASHLAGARGGSTIARFGDVASRDEVTRTVRAALRSQPEVGSYVEVTQRVFGPLDDQRVGLVSSSSWRVDADGAGAR